MKELHSLIADCYMQVCDRAIQIGLPTNNINLYIRSEMKKLLGLQDTFKVSDSEIRIITDDDNIELNENSSDIYFYDPEWR